ncbi:hypothetical protein VTN31DRAFT_384 [Thermomyces dupontii]|uniref:uncharacterized protein n=1 Tax=Talaromyces thermophilus TaxID=28565 RepID=UPI00374321C2
MSTQQTAAQASPTRNVTSNLRLETANAQQSAEQEPGIAGIQSNSMSQTSPASDTTISRPKKETTIPKVSVTSIPSPTTTTASSSKELPFAKPRAVQSTRSKGSIPLSPTTSNEIGVVANPEEFWRRFSVAVHRSEEMAQIHQNSGKYSRETWLSRQRRKARKTRICGAIIVLAIVLLATGVGVTIWFLRKNNWFQTT